jgi:type IV pilus assembly protein PilY1
MNIYKVSKNIAANLAAALILLTFMGESSQADITDLANAPITVQNTTQEVLPNIMFVLDDSGSMSSDFLPDWAQYSFPYLFKNASFNGVAYNPATNYTQPAFYSSTGAADTTTYPSQTSANTSGWTQVKNDGYGVQSTANSNLVNNAYFYTTVPGEYCDGPQLRNCIASTTATTTYKYAANLRWCDTPAAANGLTTDSNGHCQAAQIASTTTNTANGVTSYTFPRAPSLGGTATITFSGAGPVVINGLAVGAAQILSVAVNNTVEQSTDNSQYSGLLNDLVSSINACTNSAVGGCTAAGYSAMSDGISVISISAPTTPTPAPVTPVLNMTSTLAPITNPDGSTSLSQVAAGIAAFAQTPGSVIKTVIASTTASYPYPGTAAKSANRIDCASTTCTYAEEMTNYANWWTYYHTRMQMMKTGVSLAFSTIDDGYRVGYFSINNGSYLNPNNFHQNNDFVNVKAFSGQQKHDWYTNFFKAYPYGQTPLRIALSNAGRMYAGKLSTLNNSTVTDPMQYSCQQNFTILSTDGYWNDQVTPTQVDGSTAIGQQDGDEVRPYYDGATQVQIVSQTIQTVQQQGLYTTNLQSRTQQQLKSTADLTQTDVTTNTYPFRKDSTQLFTSSSQLEKTTTLLDSTTRRLTSSSYDLQDFSYQPQSTTYDLKQTTWLPQTNTYDLNQTTWLPQTSSYDLLQTTYQPNTNTYALQQTAYVPQTNTFVLNQSNYQPIQSTSVLQQLTYNPNQTIYQLQSSTFQPTQSSYPLVQSNFQPTVSTQQLQSSTFQPTQSSYPLVQSNFQPTVSTQQLQSSTFLPNVSTFKPQAASYQPIVSSYNLLQSTFQPTVNTYKPQATSLQPQQSLSQLQSQTYQLQSVTTLLQSTTYNLQSSTSQLQKRVLTSTNGGDTYTDSGWQNTSSCTPAGATPDATITQCKYTSFTPYADISGSCTTVNGSFAPGTFTSGTATVATAVKCQYSTTAVSATNLTSCTNNSQQTSSPYSPAVTCSYMSPGAVTNVNSPNTCTTVAQSTSSPYQAAVACSYSAATTASNLSSCTAAPKSTASPYSVNTAVTCSYAAASAATSVSSCTVVAQSTGTNFTGPAVSCSYPGSGSTTAAVDTCTTVAKSTSTTNGTVYPTSVSCAYSGTPTSSASASTCAVASQSTASPYATAVSCSYPATVTPTTVTSCSTVAQQTSTSNGASYPTAISCAYSTTANSSSSVATCTVTKNTASPFSGPANGCSYPASSAAPVAVDTCTTVAQATSTAYNASYPTAVACSYSGTATSTVSASTCTVTAQSTASPYATAVSCSYPASVTAVNAATCDAVAKSTSTANGTSYPTAVTCGYAAAVQSTAASCTVKTADTGPTYTGNAVSCSYSGTATSTPTVTSCTTVTGGSGAANGTSYPTKVSCAYSGTASSSSTVSSCTVSRSAASPFSGPATGCSYAATVTPVNASTCTTVAKSTATTDGTAYPTAVTCGYAAATNTTAASCTVATADAGPTYTGNAVSCSYPGTATSTPTVTSCTTVAGGSSTADGTSYPTKVSCAYSGTASSSSTVSSCTVSRSAASPFSGPATGCSYAATVTPVNASTCTTVAKSTATASGTVYPTATTCGYVAQTPTSVASCTVTAQQTGPVYVGNAVGCAYPATATATASPVTSCTTVAGATGTTTGTVYSPRVACQYAAATNANVASCTVVSPSAGPIYTGPAVACSYPGTPTNTASTTSCTTVAQATGTTNGTVYPTAVACAYATTPTTASAATCTAVPASTASPYSGPYKTCTYPGSALTTQTSCTVVPKTTSGTNYVTAYDCAYATTPTTTSAATCSSVAASTGSPYSGPYKTCTYPTTATVTNAVVTSCSTVPQTSSGSTYVTSSSCAYSATPTNTTAATCNAVAQSTGSPYAGPYKTCSYPSSSTSTVTSCTVVPKTTSGTSYVTGTDCAYSGTPSTSSAATCSAVAASTGSPYAGPYKTCTYPSSTVATVTSCTAVSKTTSGTSYVTGADCAYSTIANTPTTAATCTVATQSAGPTNYTGPQRTCAYPTTATTSPVASSCTNVAQTTGSTNGTVYQTQHVCNYKTSPTTVLTGQDTCTVTKSTSSPFTGPGVTCAYDTSTTLLTGLSTCTSAATSPGPTNYSKSVSCAYQTTPSTVNATSTCTPVAASTGPTYAAQVACAYTPFTAATLATSACTQTAQSAGPTSYSVLKAYNCTYGNLTSVNAGTCTAIPANNSNLTAVDCITAGGPFVVTDPSVSTVVSSCKPAHPYTTTNGVTTDVATTCAYASSFTAPAPAACSAISTALDGTGTYHGPATNCTLSDTGFVNTNACTPVGSISPLTYDGSGRLVQCKITDPSDTVAVNSCSPSVGTTDPYTITNCTYLQNSASAVQTCTASDTGSPSYIKTTCDSSTLQSNIAVCTPQTPSSANGYKTVTCGTTGGTSNTLADVAEYFYKTDLRTTAFGNCAGAPVGTAEVSNTLCADIDTQYNNVPTSGVDLNPAQHMTTFTLGLGASGFMQYTQKYAASIESGGSPDYKAVAEGTTASPSDGICAWQTGTSCNWPFPINNDQTGVDDLWHAGVNGRGSYFSATDPATLANSLSTALSTVSAARGSSTGGATSTPNISISDNFIFSSTFATSTWDGDINRSQINASTGIVSSTTDWSAQAKLDNKSVSTRLIYGFDASATNKLKEFTATNYGTNAYFNTPAISATAVGLSQFLCSSPTVCLPSSSQSLAAGNNLVNYLRGDRSNEGAVADNTKYYRQRSHVLGDIVNSPVTYVGPPKFSYADLGYSSFASSNSDRLSVVYVGANDGMLHAFRAKGSATAEAAAKLAAADPSNSANVSAAINAQAVDVSAGVDGGQELWAFIPSAVMPNLYKLADKNYSSSHINFVDGSQEVADICVSSCGSSSAVWKTILVGGLGTGGRAYYALDISDPLHPVALWEFTDSNLGYTFGNPQISKDADGTWVAVFSSGYNNVPDSNGAGDGQGRLYVVNAYTGAYVKSIKTSVGNTSSPSGLSKIVAEVVNANVDSTIEYVYGGDLFGNLWRFDIANSDNTNGQLLVTLADAQGHAQPLTAKPAIAIVDNSTVLYVGTGSYLAASDISNVNTQSVYAIKDTQSVTNSPTTALYANPRTTGSGFVQQVQTATTCPIGSPSDVCASGDPVRTTTNNPVSFATNNGWFLDLPDAGERANTDLVYALNLLIFNTNVPNAVACNLGGYSYQYQIDYRTGSAASGSTTSVSGFKLGNQLASSPAVYTTSTSGASGIVAGGASGTTATFTSKGTFNNKDTLSNKTPADTRRSSWRELISQ